MADSANGTIIQIRRSQVTDTPPALANGELAYSFSSDKLFIGQTNTATSAVTVEYIGGKLLVDKVANLESIVLGGSRTYTDFIVGNTFTLSTATNNGVLFAKAGGVVDSVAGSPYEVFQVAANGTPTFGELNGGTF